MEQPGEQAAEPTTGGATPGHPAGDRAEDRLAHGDPGDVGDEAVGQGGELEAAGGDEADQRILHRLEGERGHLLGGLGRIDGGIDVVAERPGHPVLPLAALAEDAVLGGGQVLIGPRQRPVEGLLLDGAGLQQSVQPLQARSIGLGRGTQLLGELPAGLAEPLLLA